MAVKEKKVANSEQLVLENRVIKVVPILRNKAFFKKDHDGNHTYTGCWKGWGLPLSARSRAYLNPFKSKEEQYAFEEIMGLDEDSLNPNRSTSKFWGEFSIHIDKEGKDLDLSIPYDALAYRVLKILDQFAEQGDDTNIPEYLYKLIDERYVEEEGSKLAIKKIEAYKALSKIDDNKKKMVDVLRLLGVRLSATTKLETLQGKLANIIEQVATVKDPKIKTIDDFLSAVNDPQAITKLFVFDALDAGELIVRGGSEYRITENNELIAKSFQGAVDWFNDPKNLDIKLLIEQRLKFK